MQSQHFTESTHLVMTFHQHLQTNTINETGKLKHNIYTHLVAANQQDALNNATYTNNKLAGMTGAQDIKS